jgi:hypothetical protein
MWGWWSPGARRQRWMTAGLFEMKAGDVFCIATGHDSWVVGDKPYVSIHLMGAYANAKKSA